MSIDDFKAGFKAHLVGYQPTPSTPPVTEELQIKVSSDSQPQKPSLSSRLKGYEKKFAEQDKEIRELKENARNEGDSAFKEENERLKAENEVLKKQLAEQNKPLSWQRERTLNLTIAALLEVINKKKLFSTQAELVNHITDNYQGFYGVGKTNLDTNFAAAKREIEEERKRLQVK